MQQANIDPSNVYDPHGITGEENKNEDAEYELSYGEGGAYGSDEGAYNKYTITKRKKIEKIIPEPEPVQIPVVIQEPMVVQEPAAKQAPVVVQEPAAIQEPVVVQEPAVEVPVPALMETLRINQIIILLSETYRSCLWQLLFFLSDAGHRQQQKP